MSFGVYVHFPYCSAHCPYCDFAVAVRRTIPHQAYADAVLRELEARAGRWGGRRLVSVYFGGGTPGLWDPRCVAQVLDGVCRKFTPAGPLEVTLEANPGDLPDGGLASLRRAGVNRLSLGVQSFAPRQLAVLGRSHGEGAAERTVAAARSAGFDNLSLDLMFALPSQDRGELERDLDGVLALEPEHLSVYNLTVEERTPFGALSRRGELPLPDEGEQATMFERVRERLEEAGFVHYEISSYARPGRRAVHNRLYWSGGEWLGLGNGAHSYGRLGDGGERWANVRSVDRYLAAPDGAIESREPLDGEALAREAIWLGLRRLDDGVVRAEYMARFGVDPDARFTVELDRLEREGLVERDAARFRLTRRGALFADEVGARFV